MARLGQPDRAAPYSRFIALERDHPGMVDRAWANGPIQRADLAFRQAAAWRRDLSDFGGVYRRTASMFPLFGGLNAAYEVLSGPMTPMQAAGDALISRLPGGGVGKSADIISTSRSQLRAISVGAADLNPKQAAVLAQLDGYGSRVIVP